ncbi:unnamed protein product [Rhizoctonia solani]|uniref:Uncharacterized protein n=1 Tax=Rhizoctonia solani TaxID=456999 RepID=A0A8H3H2W3_9AGAM|nr:unnamed protein product [Rhizoctonia solani]
MVAPSHPRWGRVIGTYSLSSDVNGANLSLDSEITGVEAMKKISRLATDADASSWSDSGINISTLECALRLTQDPMQVQHLANPPVVSGCILLMKTTVGRTSGVASPFNYEFGYLCFRLLVATLNACLLDIWNRVDEVLVRRDQFPHAAAHVLVSIEVSSAVHKQFENLQATLLLRSEVETLLDILWEDRKLFLRAFMLDVPIASGLSGLLLLFARCVAPERDSQQNPNGSTLKKKLYELALLYYLVQDSSQIGLTLNVISSNACYGDWISTPKHVDAEDSRTIMTAFIKRLSECSDPVHLIMEDASMMLRFVPLAIDAQTQDLLPEVLKHSIEYGWLVLLAQENKDEIRLLVNTLLPSLV